MIALVTGASKGIGTACARALSGAGHRVALVSRDREALGAVAASLPGESLVVPADLLDPVAIEAAFDRVEAEWGAVEILVLNAGASMSAPCGRRSEISQRAPPVSSPGTTKRPAHHQRVPGPGTDKEIR